MTPLMTTLKSAIADHQEIDIVYAGGSKPGSVRRILPVSIRDSILKAKEANSGILKSFKLDLITLVYSIPEEQPFRHYTSLHDLLLLEGSLILKSELYLEADPFHIALYKTDPHKGPVAAPWISIQRNKTESRKVYPWICKGRTYKSFQKVAEEFVRTVRAYTEASRKEHQL